MRSSYSLLAVILTHKPLHLSNKINHSHLESDQQIVVVVAVCCFQRPLVAINAALTDSKWVMNLQLWLKQTPLEMGYKTQSPVSNTNPVYVQLRHSTSSPHRILVSRYLWLCCWHRIVIICITARCNLAGKCKLFSLSICSNACWGQYLYSWTYCPHYTYTYNLFLSLSSQTTDIAAIYLLTPREQQKWEKKWRRRCRLELFGQGNAAC